jgi:SAM-dependent methyltransferase
MYNLRAYLAMMQDSVRTDQYRQAVMRTVKPGDVVLDVGAGTGVLTFQAIEAGASHVYAIESSDGIEIARLVARSAGLSERITFIREDARRVLLPQPADVLVADLRGTLPLLGDNFDLLHEITRRNLKPGGLTIPLRDRIQFAPIETAEDHGVVSGWDQSFSGVSFQPAASVAANTWIRIEARPSQILADASALPDLVYGAAPPALSNERDFVVKRRAVVHGLVAWFEAILTSEVRFSSAPGAGATIYGHAYFPFRTPRLMEEGSRLWGRLEVRTVCGLPLWQWSARGVEAGGQPFTERQSSAKGLLLDGRRIDADAAHRPALTGRGAIARFALGKMDGVRTQEQIARDLAAEFPRHFGRWEDALSDVADLAITFGARRFLDD